MARILQLHYASVRWEREWTKNIGDAMSKSNDNEEQRSSLTVRLIRSGCLAIVLIVLGRALGFC